MKKEIAKEETQPELKDILLALQRYIVANKNNCSLIYNVVSYRKSKTDKCADCGEPVEEVKENATRFGIYGHILELREVLNQLRDEVEDSVDEKGMVSI